MVTPVNRKHLAEAKFFEEKAREASATATKAEIELGELSALAEEQKTGNSRNRVLDFGTQVSKESVAEVIDQVSKWVRQDPKAEITIRFNSPGGDVLNGLALYDYIRLVINDGTPVRTVCMGMSASMAGVLLQAGSTRVVTPNSYFLIHEVSAGSRGPLEEMKNQTLFLDRLNDRLTQLISKRSTLKWGEIKKRIKTGEWILDAEQCIKYGLADEVTAE